MINVIGIASVLKNIQTITSGAPHVVRNAVDEVAHDFQADAQDTVAKDTGELGMKIGIEPDRAGDTVYAVNVGPSDDIRQSKQGIPRSVFLEFGTKKMSAKPYMRPTLDKNQEPGARKIGEAIIKACLK
jgi:HK97 gp10 family phage protein